MRQPLALFDMDKTMFNGMSYFPLLDAQVDAGLVSAAVSNRAHDSLDRYKQSSLGYEDLVRDLIDVYAEGLAGKPVDEVAQSTDEFFRTTPDFFGYVAPTIRELSRSHEVVLVTGSTQFTASAVAKVFGVKQFCSTIIGTGNTLVNGQVDSYLATRQEKREAIHHLTRDHPVANSLAFGDSEGDIEMLQAVQHAICIDPTPGLREAANENGWLIVSDHDELEHPQVLGAVQMVLQHG